MIYKDTIYIVDYKPPGVKSNEVIFDQNGKVTEKIVANSIFNHIPQLVAYAYQLNQMVGDKTNLKIKCVLFNRNVMCSFDPYKMKIAVEDFYLGLNNIPGVKIILPTGITSILDMLPWTHFF